MVIVVAYHQQLKFNLINHYEAENYYGIVILYTFVFVTVFGSSFLLIMRNQQYVSMNKKADHIDQLMRNLGIEISYKIPYLLCWGHISFIGYTFWLLFSSDRIYYLIYIDSVAIIYLLYTRYIAILLPLLFIFVAEQRIRSLDTYLQKYIYQCENQIMNSKNIKELKEIIIKVTKIHSLIVSYTIDVKGCFGFMILISVGCNLCQSIFGLIFSYIGEFKDHSRLESMSIMLLNNIQMGAMFYYSFRAKVLVSCDNSFSIYLA